MISKLQTMCAIAVASLLAGCADEPVLPERIELRMTGSSFKWEIRHAAWDSTFGTGDDVVSSRRLQVPLGIPLRIHLCSDDFIYGVSLADFDLAGIAVPGLENTLELIPQELGEFPLRGNQMCGYSHPDLTVTLEVVGSEEFAQTLKAPR